MPLRLLAAVIVLVGAAPLDAGQWFCPGEGSCTEWLQTPGCEDPICCTLVCSVDPFCCKAAWDQLCADFAQAFCNCPGEGDCFSANDTPGCDGDCCQIVCATDSYCCTTAWDAACADQAVQRCLAEASGACCMPDNSCVVLLAADCDFAGGTYVGTNTPCETRATFYNIGTFATDELELDYLSVTASDGADPGQVVVRDSGDTGMVVGAGGDLVSGAESLLIDFGDQPVVVVEASIIVENLDDDGASGEMVLEGFDENGISLGIQPIVDSGIVRLSTVFNDVPLSAFRWSAGDDGFRVYSLTFRRCGLPSFCPGDLNRDHVIGAHELQRVIIRWNEVGTSDHNADGIVDIDDLMWVILNWGECET